MLKQKIIGNICYYVFKFLQFSLRLKIIKHPEYDIKKPYLFAFWHGKQLLPVLKLKDHKTFKTALVSPSRDGEILATLLRKLGILVLRGSSRDSNIKSLKAMIKRIKNNHTIGFGIDGPIGPIYKVKPGMTYLSQKYQIPIVPIGSYFESKWVFEKAWDKFEIPKPFSKSTMYYGQPYIVGKTEDLEQANLTLEEKIRQIELEAKNF